MIGVLVVGGAFYVIRRGQPALLGGPSNPPSIAPVPSASVTPSPSPTPSRTSSVVQSKPGTFAFIRPSGNGPQLWVANMDGTGERQLAPDLGGSQGSAAWSPDGTRLVFSRAPYAPMGYPEGTTRLYLVDASGGAPQLVDTGCVAPCSGDSDAAFSSDGRRLVFVRTLALPPTSTSPLGIAGKPPRSTPASVLATIDLSTGRVEELASTTILDCPLLPGQRKPGIANCGGFQDHSPHWSPDGAQIVFTQDVPYDINGPEINGVTAPSPPAVLFVVDADGGNLRKIGLGGSGPDWSPDGARIVFGSGADVPDPYAGAGTGYWLRQYYDIYTVRPDGTDLRPIDVGPDLVRPEVERRRPDLVHPAAKHGERHPQRSKNRRSAWVMDADGSNAAQLSVSPLLLQTWPIAWSPQP